MAMETPAWITLLIVDDEELYLFSLEFALKKYYNILCAQNIHEALVVLKNDKKKIDKTLVDIRFDLNDDNNVDGIKILE